MKFFHTLVFISLPKICSLPQHVCPFLLLSVLNNTSESLKIQMLQSLWNVGANFTVEIFRTAARASWKAQAAHGASRDFQSSVLTSLSPIRWRWSQNLMHRSNVVHAHCQLHFLLDNDRQQRKLRFNLCNRSLTPSLSANVTGAWWQGGTDHSPEEATPDPPTAYSSALSPSYAVSKSYVWIYWEGWHDAAVCVKPTARDTFGVIAGKRNSGGKKRKESAICSVFANNMRELGLTVWIK